MKSIKIFAVAAAALAALNGWAVTKGSCISKAIALKGSQTARLVAEYDPEEKEYYDDGVAYYSVTLKRGTAYTVWITGGNAADIDLDVGINDEEYDKAKYEKEDKNGNDKYPIPGADFDIVEIGGGETKVAYLYADDWDATEDPKTGKYIVTLAGDIGKSTTLGFTAGIRNFTVVGSEESPKALSFSNSWKTYASKLIDGEYHFSASLKAGRKYRVRTTGGTKAANLELDVDDGLGNSDNEDDEEEQDEDITDDATYASDTNNVAKIIVPSVSGKYTFVVGGDTAQAFKFLYTAVPTRAIGSHPYIPLTASTNASGSKLPYTATFVPGRMANTQSYYDNIVDEHLCRIYLNKGERWVFETTGASKEQEMIAYDAKGKVILSNSSVGKGSYDTRVVVTASIAGLYYVGVYDPTLDVNDTPDAAEITLTARNTADLPLPDEWDPADDLYTGATPLAAWPCTTNETSVTEVIADNLDAATAAGAVSGVHRLGANDIYDYFALSCRAGCTYRLRAVFADENDTTDLTLAATAVYYSGSTAKTATITAGTSISPVTASNIAGDFTFLAKTSGIYYVRLWVDEGKGLDFPGYRLYAVVSNGEAAFGRLNVNIDGDLGAWYLNKETSVTYKSGATMALTNASATVNFSALTGYTAPAAQTVAIPAWNPGDEPVTVNARYADAYSTNYIASYTAKTVTKNGKKTTTYTAKRAPADGDDTPEGAFQLANLTKIGNYAPTAAAKTLKRTLWADDPADWFTFTAVEGTYYNFIVTNTADSVTLTVSNAVTGAVWTGTPLADGTGSELTKQALDAGKTYVCVARGDGAGAGTPYWLVYSKAATGVVRFSNAKGTAAATAFSVKEGTEYATLYVARTGTEGAVRVKYATQAGTAQPGVNYEPVTDGEISWAAGNKAVKTIKIRTIPDLNAHWAASNLTFSVRLYPVDEYDLAAGEYLARVSETAATATVAIKEASTKKPGTVSLTAYGDGVNDPVAVANVKKPVVTGVAGNEAFTLTFSRTGGADGKVSVKVATSAVKTDTAKPGTDYTAKSEVLTWEDGDAEDKTFVLDLKEAAGYTATKKFTLAMSVVKTGTTPALAAKTATVTVKNATVDQTAAAYVKTLGSTGLAAAATGTWFKDYDGTVRSAGAAGTLTYTLTGPGFFLCQPKLNVTNEEAETAATLKCQFDKEAAIDCTAEDFGGTVARVLAAGKHTVKFIVAGAANGEYATFANQPDGKPYVWIQLSGTAPADPMTKAMVQTSQAALSWTLPEGLAGRAGFWNRVRFGTTAKTLATIGYVPATAESRIALPEDALAAGKTYYWAVDAAYTDAAAPTEEELAALTFVNGTATWTFGTIADGAPITAFAATAVDATGTSAAARFEAGEPIELLQGVKVSNDNDALSLAGEGEGENAKTANWFRFVAGTLPKGVTVSAAGVLTGTPTTPGEYRALVQGAQRTAKKTTKTVNGKKTTVTTYTYVYGTTLPVTFNVLPAGTAVGTFRAALAEDGGTFAADPRRNGTLTLTTTAAGKITATVTIGGVAYKFTGTGYDEIVSREAAATGEVRVYRSELTNTTLINKKTKTYNYLTLTVTDGALTNGVALAGAMGSVELAMNVANTAKTAVTKGVSYTGDLYRNNGATDLGKAAIADFAGYYTVSLPPTNVTAAEGKPFGNGYLLLTVAAANTVKVTGVLADGTAVSFSTIGQLRGDDLADARACVLHIPVFAGKTTAYSLGGVLQIAYEDADAVAPVALPAARLVWAKPKAAATCRDGTGFAIETAPTGGWYDKVVNLQAYYLNRDFAIRAVETGDDLPAEALTAKYAFATEDMPAGLSATPDDLAVKFTGNAFSVAARKLVKDPTSGLYDFESSVNPWAVALKFTRATGVVTGTLSAWEWIFRTAGGFTSATAQKQITKLTHKGVLLFSRDSSADSPLDARALTSGFFILPPANTKTTKWKASLPFGIYMTGEDEKTWDELDFGDGEASGDDDGNGDE